MGKRYETTHNLTLDGHKTSKIVDTETGAIGTGAVYDHESYKKADDQAWEEMKYEQSKK